LKKTIDNDEVVERRNSEKSSNKEIFHREIFFSIPLTEGKKNRKCTGEVEQLHSDIS
jgi:hypothetical protein